MVLNYKCRYTKVQEQLAEGIPAELPGYLNTLLQVSSSLVLPMLM